jgi:hypothetical protein
MHELEAILWLLLALIGVGAALLALCASAAVLGGAWLRVWRTFAGPSDRDIVDSTIARAEFERREGRS